MSDAHVLMEDIRVVIGNIEVILTLTLTLAVDCTVHACVHVHMLFVEQLQTVVQHI